MTFRLRLGAMALACCAAWPAAAQDAPPAVTPREAAAGNPAQRAFALSGPDQDLYQNALQSLAEGRKNDASDTLSRLVEVEPLHAGAWLDLALIQCSLGRASEAERLFRAIETRFDPPEGILELIARTRAEGCMTWQPTSAGSINFGRGIDRNVNQGASSATYFAVQDGVIVERTLSSDFLPRHDQYTALSGEYLRDITPNGSIGFAQFQTRRNDSLHDYDSASLFVGVESPWRFKRWTLRATGMLGFIGLGGHLYQRQAQLQARIGPPLPLPESVQLSVLGGMTRTEYLTLTNFNTNTFEVRGQLSYGARTRYASTSLGFLADKANTLRPGGDRTGWVMNALLRESLTPDLTAEIGYTRQGWQGESAYAPGTINETRKQNTQVLRFLLTRRMAKDHNLQLEMRAVRNRENISIFQYNNRQLQLSWVWLGL